MKHTIFFKAIGETKGPASIPRPTRTAPKRSHLRSARSMLRRALWWAARSRSSLRSRSKKLPEEVTMEEAPPALERPDPKEYGSSYSDAYMREVVGLAELYGAVFTWEPNRTISPRVDSRGWFWYATGTDTGNKHKVYVAEDYLKENCLYTRAELSELNDRLSAGQPAPQPAGG